jgi:hypothetical protein
MMKKLTSAQEDRLIKSIRSFEFYGIQYYRLNGELHPTIRKRLDSIIKQALRAKEAE